MMWITKLANSSNSVATFSWRPKHCFTTQRKCVSKNIGVAARTIDGQYLLQKFQFCMVSSKQHVNKFKIREQNILSTCYIFLFITI